MLCHCVFNHDHSVFASKMLLAIFKLEILQGRDVPWDDMVDMNKLMLDISNLCADWTRYLNLLFQVLENIIDYLIIIHVDLN